MEKDTFMQQVRDLRQQGISIRGIASKLGVHPSKVQRAVAKLPSPNMGTPGHNISQADQKSVFVGREEELALLRRALDAAIAGHGNIVFLAGEPGIGKTRLVQELCSYAGTRQVSTYWGKCYEELQTPPYWPWIQIFRNYIQKHRASRIRSEMGTAASDIAGLAPKLVQNPRILEKLPDLKPVPPLNDLSEDRFRLFDSANSFLKRSSKRQPMLLILDNLQWCDEPSVMFLRFISQEIASNRILVVGSYRNMSLERGHSLMAAIGELSCRPVFRQIELLGLTQKETEQLVRTQGHIDSFQELGETLYNRTEGNPLFIIHLARFLAREGYITGKEIAPDMSRLNLLPDSLNMAISRNLAYLSSQCLEVLAVASALGKHFYLPVLQSVIKDILPHEFRGLLDEAVNGGIIRQMNSKLDWYQFTHALVQETLLRSITSQQRINLHARIGTALEEIYRSHITSVASHLAYHFAMSADLTGHDKAIHYCRLAAENALSVFAFEEASLQFQRALQIKQKKTPAAVDGIPDDETAEILLGLLKTGATIPECRSHESFEPMSQLLDYYLDKKDVASLIEIAIIPTVLWDIARLPEPKSRLEQIFALVSPDSCDAGWLWCIYGYFIGTYLGEYEAARDAFDRAIAIARQQHDYKLEMRALINSVQIEAVYWKADWDRVLRAVEIAQRLGDFHVEAMGRFFSTSFALTTKKHGDAEDIWEQALNAATKLRNHSLLSITASAGQVLAQHYGDFQVSRLRSEQALKGSRRKLSVPMVRAITEYELGELAEGDKFVGQTLEDLDHAPASVFVEYGWASVQLPFINYLTAREEWSDIEERVINLTLNTAPPETFFAIMVQVGLGLRAVNRKNITTAPQSYDILKGSLKSEPLRSMITPIAMSSDRLLGLLCLTFEDYDRAIRHFQDAIELCREWGFLPQLAWSCYDCSRVMLLRNQPQDMHKAKSMAGEALSISKQLGMKLLASRISSLQEIKISKQFSSTYSNNFTGREIEVLKLLAKGSSNREIAEELFISSFTAATHVRNILSKGNLANRTEAAALAARYYSQEQ